MSQSNRSKKMEKTKEPKETVPSVDPADETFTRNFHYLTALICHLATTRHRNRTPTDIATSLAMDKKEVERVLLAFPSFFRESTNKRDGQRLFTVHLRYALRRKSVAPLPKGVSQSKNEEPLNPEYLSVILQLLTQMLTVESSERNTSKEIKERTFSATTTAIISGICVLASAVLSATVTYFLSSPG